MVKSHQKIGVERATTIFLIIAKMGSLIIMVKEIAFMESVIVGQSERENGHIGCTKKAQTGPGNRVKKSGWRYLILAPNYSIQRHLDFIFYLISTSAVSNLSVINVSSNGFICSLGNWNGPILMPKFKNSA